MKDFRKSSLWPGLFVLLALATFGIPEIPGQTPRAAARPAEEIDAAWLGVWLSDAVDGGVQVLAVVGGGPAERAGLRAGDIVIEAGEEAVGSEAELGRILRAMSPGQVLALKVLRASEPLDMRVALGQRARRTSGWTVLPPVPEPAEVPAPRPPAEPYRAYVYPDLRNPEAVGLQVTEITPALRVHYGAPEETGVLVTKVETGQLAASAGLLVGDILVRIDGQPIRSEREVRGNLVRWNLRKPLVIQVVRANEIVSLDVEPPVQVTERRRIPGPRDDAERQEQMRKRLQAQIERLERRLQELKNELERVEREH